MGEMRVSRKGLNYGVHETVVKSLKKDVLLSENNLAETDEEGISAIQKIVNSFKDESDEGSNEEEEAGFDIREEERIILNLNTLTLATPSKT
ncbi:Hypothetical protein FKW44_006270 [Caligus rogercresseyi]|uniref:Uncharacterized protein n=1 Tax=Caligus rogercresseyi TaxID=217165 RepID=A0A7T8QSS3_CALRO|nr:Hypothetical protein FKW44_006270 [Caligus rogercresseyi]